MTHQPIVTSPTTTEVLDLSLSDEPVVTNAMFVETVQKNYAMYVNKCFTYVKCQATAEDAVQEGVLAAHKNLSSIKNEKALPAWLYRTIIRKAIDLLHKNKRLVLLDDQEELVTYDKYGFLNDALWAEVPSPEEEILKSEGIEQIKIALDTLELSYRIPLLLKDFEGFSVKEVAEIMKISETNTKVRIHRARIKLKAKLNAYFFPEQAGSVK